MKHYFLVTTIALVLVGCVGLPVSMLLQSPPRAQATGLPVIDVSVLTPSLVSSIEETLTVAGQYADYALQVLYYINTWVLEPLAFIQSGQAAQALTGGMLAFVSGQTNGTGQSQFMQNLPGHMQGVADNAAQSFFRQLQGDPYSPYGGVVAATLRARYLQQSSLAGFFAANRNTLPQYSSDPQAYLRGDWSNGGFNAWFALTTKSQNNPYKYHERTQRQLESLIASAQETQDKMLGWGQGFLSWCGAGTATAQAQEACNVSNNFCGSGDRAGVVDAGPVAPGAPCTQKDGTPGIVQTPGTTITGFLDKSLGLNADKINSMGNAASQITSMVGALMKTIQLAQTVINGPQGGLAGVGQAGPGQARSLIDDYTATSTGYAGASQCTINSTLAQNAPSNGTEVLKRVPDYLEAWDTIGGAAATASTTVTTLRDTCLASAQTGQARIDAGNSSTLLIAFVAKANTIAQEAQYALSRNAIDPYNPTDPNAILYVLNKARAASSTAAATVAKVTEVTNALKSGGTNGVCDYNLVNDAQSLNNLTPTAQDLGDAQLDATVMGTASTTPAGSLLLISSQGSLVDKMKLLTENATALLPQCALPN